jgi:hypothetical protein
MTNLEQSQAAVVSTVYEHRLALAKELSELQSKHITLLSAAAALAGYASTLPDPKAIDVNWECWSEGLKLHIEQVEKVLVIE